DRSKEMSTHAVASVAKQRPLIAGDEALRVPGLEGDSSRCRRFASALHLDFRPKAWQPSDQGNTLGTKMSSGRRPGSPQPRATLWGRTIVLRPKACQPSAQGIALGSDNCS